MDKSLLLEICYSIKRFSKLITSLISAGKGWPTIYIQAPTCSKWPQISSQLAQMPPLLLYDSFSSKRWCIWKWEMHTSALLCVTVLAHGSVIGKIELIQLPQSCSASCIGHREFLNKSLHVFCLLESSFLCCRMEPGTAARHPQPTPCYCTQGPRWQPEVSFFHFRRAPPPWCRGGEHGVAVAAGSGGRLWRADSAKRKSLRWTGVAAASDDEQQIRRVSRRRGPGPVRGFHPRWVTGPRTAPFPPPGPALRPGGRHRGGTGRPSGHGSRSAFPALGREWGRPGALRRAGGDGCRAWPRLWRARERVRKLRWGLCGCCLQIWESTRWGFFFAVGLWSVTEYSNSFYAWFSMCLRSLCVLSSVDF